MVGSGTRKARAISWVWRPPRSRRASATWAPVDRAGWQQVNIRRRRSSVTAPSSGRTRPARGGERLRLAVVAGCLASKAVDGAVAGRGDDPAGGAGGPPLGQRSTAQRTPPGPPLRRCRCFRTGGPGQPERARTARGTHARSPGGDRPASRRQSSSSPWNGRTSIGERRRVRELASPLERLVEVGRFDDRQAADVLLAFDKRARRSSASPRHEMNHRRGARRVKAALEHPRSRRAELLVHRATSA